MYLYKNMDAILAAGDDFDKEGGTFIPKQPEAARVTSGVQPVRVSVRESVYHILSPGFSNARLDDD